ncbi:hypothetical protein G7074_16015 [Pedobacter sp. HDW13]|uniref:hypothetical protein n=1 Tax=Pedobacter sp. HDW13 TaxID=2714940 RepID=UPI00140B7C1E|nr:hypothetical protein [Pedobacter sp. HDW13]QIL40637.1 hypothetical protein G7074_16015 [Pedobacter sp. HDW13]
MTNWTPFIYGLGAVYLLYYLTNLAFDLLKTKAVDHTGGGSLTISLADLEEPIDASAYNLVSTKDESQPSALLSSGTINSSGGVPFGELIELAAKDAILFTRQIPT